MINTLTIERFKSIRSLTLPCRRVNVFIGEPNTGKTNILEGLSLFCLQVTRRMQKALRVQVTADLFRDQNLSEPIIVGCDGTQISVTAAPGGLTLQVLDASSPQFRKYLQLDEGFSTGGWMGPLPSPHVRYYLFEAPAAGSSTESSMLEPPFGENMPLLLYSSKEARQSSARFFQNSGFRLNVDFTNRRLLVTKEVDDTLVSFPYGSASETLRRMVFYHLAVDTGEGQVLAFDEPEAHAFPPFTKQFAERMALDEGGRQFFLTTHSPYMLDSLLAKTPADDLNIVLCRMENFETKAYSLNDSQKARLMELSMDSFFNFDRLLEEPQ